MVRPNLFAAVFLIVGCVGGRARHALTSCGFFALLFAASICNPATAGFEILVDFDDAGNWSNPSGSPTSYQNDHSYMESGFVFTGGPALRQSTTDVTGVAGALGTFSWRLRDAPVSWTATYAAVSAPAIASFGFDARRWADSPAPNFSIDYSVNGGSSFDNVGTLNNAAFGDTNNWTTFNFNILTPVLADGDFIVRLSQAGSGRQVMIDNFRVTAVPEPTSLVLVGLAAGGGLGAWRRKKKRVAK